MASKSRDLSPVMGLSLRARSPVRHVACKADISVELPFITQNAVKQSRTIGDMVTDWTGPLTQQTVGAARYVRHAHNTSHSYRNYVLSVETTTIPHLLHKLSAFYETQTFAAAHTTVRHLMCVSASPTVSPSNSPTKTSCFIHKQTVSENHKTAHTVQYIRLAVYYNTPSVCL